MIVVAETKDMDRNEWLKIRRSGIGGSDAAAVAGLNPYVSRIMVYMDKIGELEPQEENEAMYWGHVMEDIVAQEFSKRTGMKIRRRNATLRHEKYPWMIANIDRMIVGKREGLECKNLSFHSGMKWEDGDLWQYELQCHHYMAVTGFKRWWLAALIGGNRFVYKSIERDEEIIESLIKLESDFWNNHVVPRIPPEMDGSEASSEYLKRKFPISNGEQMHFTSDIESLLEELDEVKKLENEAKERRTEIENKIKSMLGEYEVGIWKDRKVTWKTYESTRLDTKKFKEDHPDLFEKYAKKSSYRTFRVS